MFSLLTSNNTKTNKSVKLGYATYILHLTPHKASGLGNVCPKASKGCIESCLNTSGHGGMFKPGATTNPVQDARLRRTKLFFEDRNAFMLALHDDIVKAIKQARKKNLIPVIRLNGTSDLSWEKYGYKVGNLKYKNVFEAFPSIQFYDYTKVLGRKVKDIPNYHLTFSRSETNETTAVVKAWNEGLNVAVVYSKEMPSYAINGDEHDLRFLDPKTFGGIIGLKAKGRAKNDTTGFVVKLGETV